MDGVCKVLGISFNDSFFTLINNAIVEIENPVDTGISESNAFVTPYYYFYLDGWIFGVVVYSIAWGMLASYSYKKMKNDKELKDVYFYMIWMFTVFFSMVRSWLASPEIASAFLSYFIFVKKSNKKYMPS
jgi:oligosaccharide repeat unit polymerase